MEWLLCDQEERFHPRLATSSLPSENEESPQPLDAGAGSATHHNLHHRLNELNVHSQASELKGMFTACTVLLYCTVCLCLYACDCPNKKSKSQTHNLWGVSAALIGHNFVTTSSLNKVTCLVVWLWEKTWLKVLMWWNISEFQCAHKHCGLIIIIRLTLRVCGHLVPMWLCKQLTCI